MLTFNDKASTYGETVNINDCKVNIADCGYNLTSLTAKNGLNTDVGEWCDTLRARFTNAGADVPVLDVDIPFHHTVSKAKLTAKVVSVSREYGEANPTFKVIYTGFVNNENESVLEEPVSASVNADENSPAGRQGQKLRHRLRAGRADRDESTAHGEGEERRAHVRRTEPRLPD